MKCFYHDDLDGRASAFCVHAWVGIKDVHSWPAQYIPIQYGTRFPVEDIEPNEQVWIVDYSIEPDEMQRLLAITDEVTWIDHHKTAIEKYEGFAVEIPGYRKDGVAACVLTWQYIHWYSGRGSRPIVIEGDVEAPQCSLDYPVPRVLLLTGDRDVWAWQYGDETRYFYAGSQLHNTAPDSEFWWQCMDHEIEDAAPPNTGNRDARIKGEKYWTTLLEQGQAIEKFKHQYYHELDQSIGYDVQFAGYRCRAINVARVSSDLFENAMNNYDILLTHYHDGKQWTVSLYSKNLDVSELAKARGGGGHTGAAGFQCDELEWLS